MNDIDSQAAGAFDNSRVVRAIERSARTLAAWMSSSAAAAISRALLRGVRAHPGDVLVAAMVTHIVLMITIARPSSWHWLILPSTTLAAGIVLVLTTPANRKP